MWLVQRALKLRKEHRDWFGPEADYKPLQIAGQKGGHAIAFVRGANVVAVAPLYSMNLGNSWGDTSVPLPAGSWRNELTGEAVTGGHVNLDTLLKNFPVALLTRNN